MRDVECGKKTCPRCGEVLYADMDVCYGCLYDFTRSAHGPSEPPAGAAQEEPASQAPGPAPMALDGVPTGGREGKEAPFSPSFSEDEEETTVLDARPSSAHSVAFSRGVWVKTPGVDAYVPLAPEGICVGRGMGNQIVLHDKAVSRRHLRLRDAGCGVEVCDLGSTNPATREGARITGSELVGWGDSVKVGQAELLMVGG